MKEKRFWNEMNNLGIAVLSAELVGLCSSLLAGDVKGIYNVLVKPPLAPSGSVYGIVWIILYAFMGCAIYLVSRDQQDKKLYRKAAKLYVAQLFVNFLWPLVFFRFQLYWGALAVILVLDVLVALCVSVFAKVNKKAALLMVIYLLWVLFATYLNFGFALLNS